MFRLLLPILIVLAALVPRCALASSMHDHAGSTAPHMWRAHQKSPPAHVHAEATCPGCATMAPQPARLAVPVAPSEVGYRIAMSAIVAARTPALELPPPRSFAQV